MNDDREQEFDVIFTKEPLRMVDALQEAASNGYRPISILRVDGEYVAFLQRDKPASEEVL